MLKIKRDLSSLLFRVQLQRWAVERAAERNLKSQGLNWGLIDQSQQLAKIERSLSRVIKGWK